MKKTILVVNGHPDPESFCAALTDAYVEGASGAGADVRVLTIGKLDFEPNLRFGYRQRTELEADLLAAQDSIRWADHLVFVYPCWWGAMPGIMKGFLDRVLLPGFAFRYKPNSPLWEKLLAGKSARLLVTSDTPSWYNRLIYRRAGLQVMKRNVLGFCGVSPVRATEVGPVRSSSPERRAKWLEKAKRLGAELA